MRSLSKAPEGEVADGGTRVLRVPLGRVGENASGGNNPTGGSVGQRPGHEQHAVARDVLERIKHAQSQVGEEESLDAVDQKHLTVCSKGPVEGVEGEHVSTGRSGVDQRSHEDLAEPDETLNRRALQETEKLAQALGIAPGHEANTSG